MVVSQQFDRILSYKMLSQNRDYTEDRLISFSNDFGVTVIRHGPSQCAFERHSPPDNIQNGGCPGGNASQTRAG
jgi:hypothetical protein